MALVANRHFLSTTRALLRRDRPVRPLDLFQESGIPKTQGYRVLRFYEVHGAVRKTRTLEVDARRILSLQGGLRADRTVPDRTLQEGPPLETACSLLDANGIPYAVGFQTAANLHAYFEPAGAHTIYIGRTGKTPTTRLLTQVEETLMGHDATSPRDTYEFFLDDLERLEVQTDHRGHLTSPLQTLLDLYLHGRMAAHREFLLDQLQKQGVLDDRS
jgi:hypothetical protein